MSQTIFLDVFFSIDEAKDSKCFLYVTGKKRPTCNKLGTSFDSYSYFLFLVSLTSLLSSISEIFFSQLRYGSFSVYTYMLLLRNL